MTEIETSTGGQYVCVLVDNTKVKIFNSKKLDNKVSTIT